ncbi:MAG: hypothetical protein AAFO07_22510 [Bacteroidota bacterium]
MGARISAFGHYIPSKKITNLELAKRFSIEAQKIENKTGIIERRYCDVEATSDMAYYAIQDAILNSNLDVSVIDCLIVATITPDYRCPSTAAILQQKLNINNIFSFDIMAACCGYLYALSLAKALIESKMYKNIMILGAEKLSSITDENDRKACRRNGD